MKEAMRDQIFFILHKCYDCALWCFRLGKQGHHEANQYSVCVQLILWGQFLSNVIYSLESAA